MSVFSLFVDLKANTADFVSGMSTASYAAKKAGRDIEESFSSLGNIASVALAPFGQLGAAIGESLGKIGEYAASASGGFAKLGGGMSEVAVGGGVAVGAMAAVGAGAIGMAIKTAESAEKMLAMSRSTGLSVESLSTWSFIAKQSGIDQEVLVKSLQLLDTQMLKAATSAPGTINAFQRLGLSVRDGNGDLKDAGEMMEEVISKLGAMKDQTAAVALARQVMGRGGSAMLAVDPDELQGMITTAQKLNVVLGDDLAEASHKFMQSLGSIEAAGDGVMRQLTRDLLPALQTTAKFMVDGLSDPGSGLREFVKDVAIVTKDTIGFGAAIVAYFDSVGTAIRYAAAETINYGVNAGKLTLALAGGDLAGIKNSWHDLWSDLEGGGELFLNDEKKIWTEYSKFVSGINTPLENSKPHKPPDTGLGQPSIGGISGKDEITDLLTKLAAEESAELSVAGAIQQSVAAMTLAKAAGEADVKITDIRNALLEREKTLREQLAGAKAGAHPEETAKYSAELASVENYVKKLEEAAPRIRAAFEKIAAVKFTTGKAEELAKETREFDLQIASMNSLSAAYAQGGAAIAAAQIDSQLQKDKLAVADIAEEYALLSARLPENALAFASWAQAMVTIAGQLNGAQAALQTHREQLSSKQVGGIQDEINKQTQALRGEAAAYQIVAAAAFSSAAAQRQAAASGEVAKFSAANPAATDPQKSQVYQNAIDKLQEQYNLTILQEAARADLLGSYDLEKEKLGAVYEVLVANGRSTVAIDAQIYEAQQKISQQWDEAVLNDPWTSLGEKFKAFANEIELQGKDLGPKIFSSMSKAVDDVSTQLAKLVVTGKSNFKQLFESLEESIVKAQIQSVFGRLTEAIVGQSTPGQQQTGPGGTPGTFAGPLSFLSTLFGGKSGQQQIGPGGTAGTFAGPLGLGGILGKVFGSGGGATSSGAPDGSQSSPFYVISSAANIAGSASSPFSFLTGGGSDSSSGSGGGLGSIVGDVFSAISGGGLAGGGDMTPGKAYLVGEKHPEILFAGRNGGHVVPSLSGSSRGAAPINVSFNVHGATDADSFKRSSSQIMAGLLRTMAVAHSRH